MLSKFASFYSGELNHSNFEKFFDLNNPNAPIKKKSLQDIHERRTTAINKGLELYKIVDVSFMKRRTKSYTSTGIHRKIAWKSQISQNGRNHVKNCSQIGAQEKKCGSTGKNHEREFSERIERTRSEIRRCDGRARGDLNDRRERTTRWRPTTEPGTARPHATKVISRRQVMSFPFFERNRTKWGKRGGRVRWNANHASTPSTPLRRRSAPRRPPARSDAPRTSLLLVVGGCARRGERLATEVLKI